MKIDQALFGYDGGHRLLASSIALGSDASLLTELSDLAPGAIFGNGDGYWTGLPLPSMKKYALLRTWPAPEMPRPGCVWTQALFLDPKVFESLIDLSVLQRFAIRPIGLSDSGRYKQALELPLNTAFSQKNNYNNKIASSIIFNLYTQKESAIKTRNPTELVEPLFSVWSQQWPRLRRNFKFQTALTRSPQTSSSIRLDITNILATSSDTDSPELFSLPWVRAAQQDIHDGHEGSLRSFLRKYGADVKKQKASFRPLVEIFMLDADSTPNSCTLVLNIISNAFPLAEDANKLKTDLINGEIVHAAQSGLVLFLLKNKPSLELPLPTEAGLARIAQLWPKHPDELLPISELAVQSSTPLALSIQKLLTQLNKSAHEWLLMNSSFEVIKFLCTQKPSLMTEQNIRHLSDEKLIELLPLIVANPNLFTALADNIFTRESRELASALLLSAPPATAAQILTRASTYSSRAISFWLKELLKHPSTLLSGNALKSISDPNILLACVDSLGWLSSEVLKATCTPWLTTISNIGPNLSTKNDEKLASFLLILALQTGGDSGQKIIEQLFDALHSKIIHSELDKSTIEFMSPYLASAGFFRSWDLGLRLRLSVVDAYVKFNWSRSSFLSLSNRRKTRKMLAETASEIEEARYYVDEALL